MLLVGVILADSSLIAGEFAILHNGSRMKIDRHETMDGVLRLHTGIGYTELPANAVASFEFFEDLAPPANLPIPVQAKPATPPPETNPRILLHQAALDSGLPSSLVESVAQVESNFRSDAISPKGALGIMQLMPETAKKLAADPNDPVQNTQAGARLLRELLIRYNGDVPKALAAYNAGSEAVDRYHGIPPYPETQNYVNQVIRNYVKAGGR
jgi:soluble lytic murein transglycosylase-like protein